MGIFSNIVSSVKSSVVGKALDTLSAAFIKPVETVQAIFSPTKTISDVIKKVDEQPLGKNIASTVINTVTAASVIAGVGAVSSAAKGGTLVSTVSKMVPKSLTGKAVAVVAAPVIVGAVASQPLKAIEAVVKTPSALANVGGNLANLAADPSISNVKTLVKENPVITTAAAVAGVAAVGAGLTGVVSGVLTRQELSKQTEALERSAKAAEKAIQTQPIIIEKSIAATEKEAVIGKEENPILPATTRITSTRKYKRKAKKQAPSMRQSVRVNVIAGNTVSNKRYIKNEILN